MDKDILVLVAIYVDNEEVSFQVREIITLENIIQLRIRLGMSTQKDESEAALR